MNNRIRRAGVLGSGVMGTGIAAHLANAGIRCYLLDIVPKELTPQEEKKGMTKESPAFRNRIAESNKAALLKAKSSGLMDKADADLIVTGNMEDHLEWLRECDWVVEAVSENLEIKRGLLQKIAPYLKDDAIVSSNTSSLPISKIAENMPPAFRERWLGTHFFNPVRQMKLLEIIPTRDTRPEVAQAMAAFGERVLGKGIVWAKDTPAFVANRIGNFALMTGAKLLLEMGMTIEEVDALSGTAIGRPRTGVFGLYDLSGLDIGIATVEGISANVDDPDEKAMFRLPDYCYEMQRRGLLGNKTGGGAYRREGKERLVLDLDTFEYRPAKKTAYPSLEAAEKCKSLSDKLTAFFEGSDKAADFVWQTVTRLFLYAASLIPEISDNILNLDRGLCWGYNYIKGPFGLWDGLDLAKYIERMEREGNTIPAWLKEMLAAGVTSFYKQKAGVEYYYSIPDKGYLPVERTQGAIVLEELSERIVQASNEGVLYDIGDKILCLEMRGTATVTLKLAKFIQRSLEELDANWDGMVVCAANGHFGTGMDLKQLGKSIEGKQWDELDACIKEGQEVFRRVKFADKPIVFAVKGKTLDASCELAMQGAAIQAHAETRMGLAAIGAGVIPVFGGLRELVTRVFPVIESTAIAPVDVLMPAFRNMINSAVSGSAKEAKRMGYLRAGDGITMNGDLLISDAKRRVLRLLEDGYAPPVERAFPALGQTPLALLKMTVLQLMQAGYASEYDLKVAYATVDGMAGGEIVRGEMIDERYLDDLARQIFLGLCKEAGTKERVLGLLQTGKPVRN